MRRKIDATARFMARLIVATIFLLLLTRSAFAVPDDQSGFSIIIEDVRTLSLDSEITYFAPDVMQILSGWTGEQVWTTTINANVDWVLTIRGTEAFWDGPWQKPVGDIWWEYNGGGFVPLDTEPAEVCSAGPSDHQVHQIRFRLAVDLLKDIPGDYYYGYLVLELAAP